MRRGYAPKINNDQSLEILGTAGTTCYTCRILMLQRECLERLLSAWMACQVGYGEHIFGKSKQICCFLKISI